MCIIHSKSASTSACTYSTYIFIYMIKFIGPLKPINWEPYQIAWGVLGCPWSCFVHFEHPSEPLWSIPIQPAVPSVPLPRFSLTFADLSSPVCPIWSYQVTVRPTRPSSPTRSLVLRTQTGIASRFSHHWTLTRCFGTRAMFESAQDGWLCERLGRRNGADGRNKGPISIPSGPHPTPHDRLAHHTLVSHSHIVSHLLPTFTYQRHCPLFEWCSLTSCRTFVAIVYHYGVIGFGNYQGLDVSIPEYGSVLSLFCLSTIDILHQITKLTFVSPMSLLDYRLHIMLSRVVVTICEAAFRSSKWLWLDR